MAYKKVDIMFDDLIDSKKIEILDLFNIKSPKEANFDVVPLTTLEYGEDEEEENK